MIMTVDDLFPYLRTTGYKITSPPSPDYNCAAWAAHEDDRWWWPDPAGIGYWPESSHREENVEAFVQVFIVLGYAPCDGYELEPGFEKIAIFVDSSGAPTHMARQLSDGRWTSKLGRLEDIEHTLDGLINSVYGSVAQVLRRPATGS